MQIRRGRLIPGLLLILLGVAFLLRDYFEVGPGLVLLLLGLVFLVPYVLTRRYGWLVPGMILIGLGIGLMYERGSRTDVTAPLGLGLGFIAIFAVDFIATRRVRGWSLIPGVILAAVGLIGVYPEARAWLDRGWPVLLIMGGLLLLAFEFFKPRTGTKDKLA